MSLGRVTDAPEIHGDREGSTNRRVQLGTDLLEGRPPLQRAVPKCQLHFNFRQFLQQRWQRSSDVEKEKILLWIWKSAMRNDLNLHLIFNRENFLEGSSLLWEKDGGCKVYSIGDLFILVYFPYLLLILSYYFNKHWFHLCYNWKINKK